MGLMVVVDSLLVQMVGSSQVVMLAREELGLETLESCQRFRVERIHGLELRLRKLTTVFVQIGIAGRAEDMVTPGYESAGHGATHCVPHIGLSRGPADPYGERWEARYTEGVTETGRTVCISDSRTNAERDKHLAERWKGRTTFHSMKQSRHGKELLHPRSQELTSGSFGIRVSSSPHTSLGRLVVGDRVDVKEHGMAVVAGIGCCGFPGVFAVRYTDGTSYHIRPSACVKVNEDKAKSEGVCTLKKARWADVDES